jgi:hypothetical protein
MDSGNGQNNQVNAAEIPAYAGMTGGTPGMIDGVPQYSRPMPPPPRPPKPKVPFLCTGKDSIFAIVCLILGFLFFEFDVFAGQLGTFIFFLVVIVSTFIYMEISKNKQNARSYVALGVLLLSIVPFLIYDATALTFFQLLFSVALCITWVMYSARTQMSEKLSGFIIGDLFNQTFIVPFANYGGIFLAIRDGLKTRKGGKRFLFGIIGLLASIPIIIGVVALLISADSGFEQAMKKLSEAINLQEIGTWILYLIIGVPIACYAFGLVYGNSHKRTTSVIDKKNTSAALLNSHKLPKASLYGPLIILTIIYIAFFVAMGSYLFSAFGGDIPGSFTYAEYARRGFFELCGVAAINLAVIVIVYWFAKRAEGEYPKLLRVLTGSISGLTVLLILTAGSKMVLYISTYGLSQLRVYTLWFMALLLLIFLVLVIWHVRPFNAGRPIVIIFVSLFLALSFGNVDGVIAQYNVDKYMSGELEDMDVEMFRYMSDAVIPPLEELKKNAPDESVRQNAAEIIRAHKEPNPDDMSLW